MFSSCLFHVKLSGHRRGRPVWVWTVVKSPVLVSLSVCRVTVKNEVFACYSPRHLFYRTLFFFTSGIFSFAFILSFQHQTHSRSLARVQMTVSIPPWNRRDIRLCLGCILSDSDFHILNKKQNLRKFIESSFIYRLLKFQVYQICTSVENS